MTKMHYKKIGAMAVAAGVFFAVSAFAQDVPSAKKTPTEKAQLAQDKREAREEARVQNVCEKISQFAENLNQKASEKEGQVKTRHEERFANWENKTKEADAKLAKLREGWDVNRGDQFSTLEEAVETDAQGEAVKKFEATVKEAIATRRAAVDAAILAFRTGVKNAITTRQGQVDGIISGSSSARLAALDKAKADCEAGKDSATVRASFQNGLKSARIQLQNDKKNVDKVSSTVQSLIQTRRTAVEKAMSDFKATMEKARTELKKSFAENPSTDDSIENES